MSSWCIGLKAGPAGLPALVRAGGLGCSPTVSGANTPSSTFAMPCASSSVVKRRLFVQDLPVSVAGTGLPRYNGDRDDLGESDRPHVGRLVVRHLTVSVGLSPIRHRRYVTYRDTVKIGERITRWPNARPPGLRGARERARAQARVGRDRGRLAPPGRAKARLGSGLSGGALSERVPPGRVLSEKISAGRAPPGKRVLPERVLPVKARRERRRERRLPPERVCERSPRQRPLGRRLGVAWGRPHPHRPLAVLDPQDPARNPR